MALHDAPAARPGQLDRTFGVGGKVQTDFDGNSDYGRGLALQPDGKLVVVGFSGVYPGFNSAVARHNSDGSLDTTFGNGGIVISHFSTTDSLDAVAIQSDGKIVVVGSAQATSGNNGTNVLVARYNSNGTLDTTFGTNGAVITKLRSNIPPSWYFSASAQDVAVLADGKILVAGQTTSVAFGRMALLRYNSNGTLDQTYGDAGKVITEFPVGPNGVNGGVGANALALQADGKAVLAGSYVDNSFSEFALARINPDGSPDTTFGTDGRVTTSIGSGDGVALEVLMQPDGKIVAGGYFQAGIKNRDFALARYNTDGTLDTSFGRGGIITNDLTNGSDDEIISMVLQADNRIIAAGETGQYPSFDFGLARYTTTGRLDNTFGQKGKVSTDFGKGSFDIAYGVVIGPDGKIVVAGETNAGSSGDFDFALARYLNP
ncbi:MAG: delta-60 repeat domain-containing protein [Nitrospirota bacterium]